jgi:hypothetical protein
MSLNEEHAITNISIKIAPPEHQEAQNQAPVSEVGSDKPHLEQHLS